MDMGLGLGGSVMMDWAGLGCFRVLDTFSYLYILLCANMRSESWYHISLKLYWFWCILFERVITLLMTVVVRNPSWSQSGTEFSATFESTISGWKIITQHPNDWFTCKRDISLLCFVRTCHDGLDGENMLGPNTKSTSWLGRWFFPSFPTSWNTIGKSQLVSTTSIRLEKKVGYCSNISAYVAMAGWAKYVDAIPDLLRWKSSTCLPV